MKKTSIVQKIAATMAAFCATQVMAETSLPESGSLAGFLQKGQLAAKIGTAGNYLDHHQQVLQDTEAMWGLVELSYTTPSWHGLTAGGGLVGALKLAEKYSGDYRSIFADDLDLKELFLSYDLLGTPNSLLVGRKQFTMNPSFKGDSHQGVQFAAAGLKPATLVAGVVDRWIHHSTTSFNGNGITGWEDIDDVQAEAGKQFYTAALLLGWGEELTFQPYVNHQDEVMTVYGVQLKYNQPLLQEWRLAFEGIVALYGNNVPKSIAPHYEDVTSARLHASIGHDDDRFGIGWFHVSDDRGDINAGIFSAFDPLQEDDLFPYNDNNNCHLLYVDSHLSSGPFSTDIAFGYGRNGAIESYSREFDFWLYYDITPHLQLGGYFIWVKSDAERVLSYNQVGASLTYFF